MIRARGLITPRKHGTFRPRLTQLVASNGEEDIERTTREAFKIYASNPNDYAVSINKLATLKGIGPATASLLLSVYDPENVPFFSDELFRWICWDEKSGWGRKIKYDVKEYKELFEGVETVRERLKRESGEKEGFRAVDLEKGAFVLGREALAGVGAKRKSQSVGEAGEKRKSQSVGEAGENAIPLGSVTKKRRTSGRQQESKDDSFE